MMNSGRRKEGMSDFLVNLAPGMVMVDTGCRAACGGTRWHQELQAEMGILGRSFYAEEQDELFQFGPGKPIQSTKKWVYEVGLHGTVHRLVSSEIPAECPGLVGPDELAEWEAILDFSRGTMSIGWG